MPHGARESLPDVHFNHPQVYKNGVLLWDLNADKIISKMPMDQAEVIEVCTRLHQHGINPWINTIDHEDIIGAIIAGVSTPREKKWVDFLNSKDITGMREGIGMGREGGKGGRERKAGREGR